MKKGLLLAVILALTACDDATPPEPTFRFSLTGNPSPEDQTRLTAGLNAFIASCQPLFTKYWGDVLKPRAYMGDPKINYTGNRYGWTREIWIEVEVVESPKRIPNSMNAWGHTLMWVAGTGRQPGLIAKKDQAAEICGMPPSRNGVDVFKPDQGFAVLSQ